MLEALKKGDKVQTIGGIRGVIASIKDDSVVVKVDDNAKIEFVRSAVSAIVEVKDDKKEPKKETKKEKEEETAAE